MPWRSCRQAVRARRSSVRGLGELGWDGVLAELVGRELAIGRRLPWQTQKALGDGIALHLGGPATDAVAGEAMKAPARPSADRPRGTPGPRDLETDLTEARPCHATHRLEQCCRVPREGPRAHRRAQIGR